MNQPSLMNCKGDSTLPRKVEDALISQQPQKMQPVSGGKGARGKEGGRWALFVLARGIVSG